MIRQPAAAEFYAGDCARMADGFLRGAAVPSEPKHIVAGVVPHAGWIYSGAVAAQVFGAIQRKQRAAVESFIIFGAIHRWAGRNAVYSEGKWATPLGPVDVDEQLAGEILAATGGPGGLGGLGGLLAADPQAHAGEHAIEVQMPFIKHLFPRAKVVPISVGPDAAAAEIGRRVGELVKSLGREIAIIGSTDLTHYGEPYQFMPMGIGERASAWMRANDRRMIDLALGMDAAGIVGEAREHHNACGAGALSATVAAAEALGARQGHLLSYRTSFDAAPEAVFRTAVGYAGIVF